MNLNFRFPREIWREYLVPMEDGYSSFCRNAILKELQVVNSEQYADSQINYHQNKVKEWKERKKSSREDLEEVKNILEMGFDRFKEFQASPMPDVHSFKLYLRANILPKLSKAHCTRFDESTLLEMYQKGEISIEQ